MTIAEAFAQCRRESRKAFIPFIAAGDPDWDTTAEALAILDDAGADVIELGVPFSDPIADGPVIQASYQRSLEAGTSLAGILEQLPKLGLRTPLLLFTYVNPVLQYALRSAGSAGKSRSEALRDGLVRFARKSAAGGVRGILMSDLTPEEAKPYQQPFRTGGIDTVFLAAPTTTEARFQKILPLCSGFLYLISRTGVTGKQTVLGEDVESQIAAIRRLTSIPVAIGFGMRTPEDVRRGCELADGVVVGSAIVDKLYQLSRRKGWQKAFGRYVGELATAARD
jgi:tryptophan synthase alpha chain